MLPAQVVHITARITFIHVFKEVKVVAKYMAISSFPILSSSPLVFIFIL